MGDSESKEEALKTDQKLKKEIIKEVKENPLPYTAGDYIKETASARPSLFNIPFFDEILSKKRILLSGCGGGFDIYSGIPLYLALRKLGKEVYLANLTFTGSIAQMIQNVQIKNPDLATDEKTLKVTSDLHKSFRGEVLPDPDYFPEYYLSQWFDRQDIKGVPVYTFDRNCGVKPLQSAYETLCNLLKIDCVVLVDGGTDSLMRGDETSLGSPEEDATSIAALHYANLPTVESRLIINVGFGVDTFHGVRHGQWLRNVAQLIEDGAYKGCFALMEDMPEVKLYREAASYVFERMSSNPSIVVSHTIAAMEGKFGDYHPNSRTRGSELFINPLMALVWAFDLPAVAKNLMYLELVKDTMTRGAVQNAIWKFRGEVKAIEKFHTLPH